MKTLGKTYTSFLILLSAFFFTNCSPTKCNFNTETCEVTIKGSKYKIIGVSINKDRKQIIMYNLKKYKTGENNINLCNPDTSLYSIIKDYDRLLKGDSYYITVGIGTDRDPDYIYHHHEFEIKLDSTNWANKIVEGTWVTL